MSPKKLIRPNIAEKLQPHEVETITDQDELNHLYALKIKEELAEIQAANFQDIKEFADLLHVIQSFALQNGHSIQDLHNAFIKSEEEKGVFGRIALNNLNPNNPSNKIYF